MWIDLETRQPIVSEGGNLTNSQLTNGVPSYLTDGKLEDSSLTNAERDSLPPISSRPNDTRDSSKEEPSNLLSEITLPLLRAEDEVKAQYNKDGTKWEPQSLKPRHREMMRRILEGASYIDIAEAMGISPQSVMLVANSTIFKEELKLLDAELNLNVIRRAEELSNEALDKLKVLMRRARSESLQASCAEKVLGIAGYSKIEKKQVQVISGEDVIRELNRQRREGRGEASQLGFNRNSRANDRISINAEAEEISA